MEAFAAGDRLILRAARCLDLSACPWFHRTVDMIGGHGIRQVVVDLGATREVRDSGLALLLMLRRHLGDGGDDLTLINCRPEILGRLDPLAPDVRIFSG